MRPTERRLRLAFASALRPLLPLLAASSAAVGSASALALASGCGDGDEPFAGVDGNEPSDGFTSMCEPRTESLPTGIQASPPVDGIAYRTEYAFGGVFAMAPDGGAAAEPEGDGWRGSNSIVSGAPCGAATNRDACLAAFEGHRLLPTDRETCVAQFRAPVTGGPQSSEGCHTSYWIYSRGDEVAAARTVEDQKALIGTIDNVAEAEWVAARAGFKATCDLARSQYRATDEGFELDLVQYENCGKQTIGVRVRVDRQGNLTEVARKDLGREPTCYTPGRRPLGWEGPDVEGAYEELGAHFASMATLEAASVVAFRRLADRLRELGAPEELLARIARAADDEVRHAASVGALAERYGSRPTEPVIDALAASPTRLELALDNAREGCVRETFGALVAHLQAERAASAAVRRCMRAIASEETEHAALSWDLAAWLEEGLTAAERDLVADARREAFGDLRRALATDVGADLQRVAGYPNASEASLLLAKMGPTLLG